MAQLGEDSLIWSQLLIVTIWNINAVTLTGENIKSIIIPPPKSDHCLVLSPTLLLICLTCLVEAWMMDGHQTKRWPMELGAAIKPARHLWKVLLRPTWLGDWGHHQVLVLGPIDIANLWNPFRIIMGKFELQALVAPRRKKVFLICFWGLEYFALRFNRPFDKNGPNQFLTLSFILLGTFLV